MKHTHTYLWDKFMLSVTNQRPNERLSDAKLTELYPIFLAGYNWGVQDMKHTKEEGE